jgi:radical SAM superfamily enzyme YgiQ (UPF0313 family)
LKQKVFLLKVPYCPYEEKSGQKQDFRTKSPFRPIPSLALASLAAFIERYKSLPYEVEAVDINIEGYTTPNEPIDPANYLTLMENRIKNAEYDVLGLSVMFVYNLDWAAIAIKLSRKYHPNAQIIMGGGYPTLFPEKALENHGVDAAVIGEGEATLLHLLNQYNNHQDPEFEAKFPFEGYAQHGASGSVQVVPHRTNYLDLADLPRPAWEHLDIDGYFKRSGDNTLPIEGSRGCPYNCYYCCTYMSWGRKLRYKPVDDLIAEIEYLNQRYHKPYLFFGDDNLSFSKPWMVEFLNKFIEKDFSFDLTVSNFSIKHLDEEIIDLLKKSGVRSFSVAVETGSPEMQTAINKKLNLDKVRETCAMMRAKDVYFRICWMVGFPGEKMSQIQDTFDLARELKANHSQFNVVLPYPGTKMYLKAHQDGLLLEENPGLDKFDYRRTDYFKSEDWNYPELRSMVYDHNIELNFLANPGFNTPSGRERLLGEMLALLKKLPEHVIGIIVVGHLYGLLGKKDKRDQFFQRADELLSDESLASTFSKYLGWDFPAVKEFKKYGS